MQQKRVVITGAGSGLGRALAFCFAEHGWRVACADIRLDRAQDTVRLMREFGVGAMALRVDVGDDASVEAMHDEILAAWDGVDCIVNNAGVASAGSMAQTSLDDWRWTLNIDLMGAVRVCHAFLPTLLEQGNGHIVNIASFAGIANAPRMGAYSAAKAGLISLSETLRAEFAQAGDALKVSVVCPAFFQTNLMETARVPAADKALCNKWMKASRHSADEVAARIFKAVQRGEFMILPTDGERARWRLKRFAPNLFLRRMLALLRQQGVAS